MDDTFFPFVGVEADYEISKNTTLPLLKELRWDYKTEKFIIDKNTNEFIVLEGKEALKVWIYHALKCVRYEHEIYSWDYGTELTDLVGQKFTKGLTESEAFRYVKEALLINPYILNVRKRKISFSGDDLRIEIICDTVYGEVAISV